MESLQCSGPLPGRTHALRLTPKARASRRLGFSRVSSSVCQPRKMLETGPRTQEEDTGGHPRLAEPEDEAVFLPTPLTRPQRDGTQPCALLFLLAPQTVQWQRAPLPVQETQETGLIPESRRAPRVGSGNPLQYSRLGNPMDKPLVGYSPWGLQRVGHDSAAEHTRRGEKRKGRRGSQAPGLLLGI